MPVTPLFLLAYPDGCTKGETVIDPRNGEIIVQVPPLSVKKLYLEEGALIDLVAAERMEGRRVLVYATHTGTRDITGWMDDILTRHGFRVAVMRADAVAPENREAWVANVERGGGENGWADGLTGGAVRAGLEPPTKNMRKAAPRAGLGHFHRRAREL